MCPGFQGLTPSCASDSIARFESNVESCFSLVQMHQSPGPTEGSWFARKGKLGLFFFVVNAHGFQIFGLEDLTALQAAHVFNTIAPCQHLGFFVIAGGHTNCRYSTILVRTPAKSSPHFD